MSKIVKKFINSPEDCVLEGLKGLVLADDGIKFHKVCLFWSYRSRFRSPDWL